MLVAHCTAPVLALFVLGLPALFGAGDLRERRSEIFLGMGIVCFVSSLLSFPASVLQMIVRAFAQSPPGQRKDRP
jgi:hypothetical protein